jgi:hypothetical protein
VEVSLDGTDHLCCGERRTVGDVVTITAARGRHGNFVEIRHDYSGGRNPVPTVEIHGRVTAIAVRPGILEHVSDVHYRVVGFGLPVPYESTDVGDALSSSDEFVFTIETDHPLPAS